MAPRPRGLARLPHDLAALARRLRRARSTSRSTCTAAREARGSPGPAARRRASATTIHGPGLDVHQPWCHAPPTCAPRHSVRNQWDLLPPLGIAPRDPATDRRGDGRRPRGGRDASTARLRAAGITPRTRAGGDPRQRRQPVPALAAPARSRTGRRRCAARPGSAHHPDVRTVRRRAARRHRRRGTCSGWAIAPTSVPDTGEFDLPNCEPWSREPSVYIGGDSGPLHVAADDPYADRGPARPDAAGAVEAVARPALVRRDGGSLELPCRPCHQRVCEPGDFRCLTWIEPERVLEATERALAAAAQR